MKGKKLKYCIFCLGIILIGGIIVAVFHHSKVSKSADLIQYLNNICDIEFGNYAEIAVGEVEIDEYAENHCMIKMRVLMGYENTILQILNDNFPEIKSNPYGGIPPLPPNSLIEEVETKEWEYTFSFCREGRSAKTKETFIFVTYDNDRMYIYFWE